MAEKRKKQSRSQLSQIPAEVLYAELEKRKKRVRNLVARYERLREKLEILRELIRAEGGRVGEENVAVPGISRRRPYNETPLKDMMLQLLKGKALTVEQLTQDLVGAGYRSSSPRFRAIVNQTLIKDPAFKRIRRGVYTAK